MGYWTAFKLAGSAVLKSWKFWLIIGGTILLATYSYQKGKQSCQQAAYEALEDELERQQDKAAKAVKQAVKDAKAVTSVKESNDELMEEAKAAASGNCALDDSQLRILQRVQEGTANR